MVDIDKIKKKIGQVEITMGAVLPSTGSTSATKTGAWRALRPIFDFDKCISCGTCWGFCPEGCIFKRKEDNKFDANLDYCKGCGICADVCPVKCITMEVEKK